MKLVTLFCFLLLAVGLTHAQNFDLLDKADTYTATFSQTIKIPIKIRNQSDKAQFYVIRLNDAELSGTQKGYFCLDKTCLEAGITEFSKKIEAGSTLEGLYFVLETGLIAGQYPIKFEVFARGNIQSSIHHSVNVNIEEKQPKSFVYQSKDITIHDVYPNPVVDQAFIEYRLHTEAIKAKLVVHNILGSSMNNLDLPYSESKVKIQAEDLTPGVYFYTLYLDNIGVVTRKLIVRR
jgi:hypothetical protein